MTFRQGLDQFGCPEGIATEVCVPKVLYQDEEYVYLQKLRNFKSFGKYNGFPLGPIGVEVNIDATKFKGRNKKALKVSKKVYYGCLEIYNYNQPLKYTKGNFERN